MRFRMAVTLAVGARPSVNQPQVLELMRGDYFDRRENVLLVGPSGTGKSHLETSLGMAA